MIENVLVPVDGSEDANKAIEFAVDMAILDIMGVDGYRLLEIANEKKVMGIMLTANALSVEDTFKSFKKGVASYVPKDEMANITTFLEDILEAKLLFPLNSTILN